MEWTHDGDVSTATGQYDRSYRVEPFNGRWRAHADNRSQVYTTREDAVKWCEHQETEMRKGYYYSVN